MLTIAYMESDLLDILTSRQKIFVESYIKVKNASEAARNAGYSESGCHVAANRLLKNDKIRRVLAKYQAQCFNISKEEFEKTCWNEYETSEDKSDRARFLDLVGRACGYLKTSPDIVQNVSILSVDELKNLHNSRATNNLQKRDTMPLSDTMPIKIIPEVDGTHTIPLQNVSDTPSNSDNVT